jgi:hypothetical protein
MSERQVRFLQSFFDDLDRQLPDERGTSGGPSAVDFLLYDLPPIRDALAIDFAGATTVVPGFGQLRVFLGTSTLVRGVAVYALLATDDHVDVVGIEVDTAPFDIDDAGWIADSKGACHRSGRRPRTECPRWDCFPNPDMTLVELG